MRLAGTAVPHHASPVAGSALWLAERGKCGGTLQLTHGTDLWQSTNPATTGWPEAAGDCRPPQPGTPAETCPNGGSPGLSCKGTASPHPAAHVRVRTPPRIVISKKFQYYGSRIAAVYQPGYDGLTGGGRQLPPSAAVRDPGRMARPFEWATRRNRVGTGAETP